MENQEREIKVEKILERYTLTKQNTRIYVDVIGDKLTITPNNNHSKFEFCNSEPEMVYRIAELILKAVEMVNKTKGRNNEC